MITADPKSGLPVHQGIFIDDSTRKRIKSDLDSPAKFDFKRLFKNEASKNDRKPDAVQ